MAVKKAAKEKSDIIQATGKRKTAVARAHLKPGKGIVRVNTVPLDVIHNEMLKQKMQEPLVLLGNEWKKFDIAVTVKGGGPVAQAEAVRMAIAKTLIEALGGTTRKTFVNYDRYMVAYDPRRAEPHKPPHSSWGARRYKQRSKR